MAGAKKDQRKRFLLSKLAQGKGEVRKPKALLLSYCTKELLIQFTRLGPFRDWPKLQGFSGMMV